MPPPPPPFRLLFALAVTAVAAASPARGDDVPAPGARVASPAPPRSPRFFEGYVPAIPVSPSRTGVSAVAMPPSPWLLTDSEAGTPVCGRLAVHGTRLSDERAFSSADGVRFELDGEVQVVTVEAVSPRLHVDVGTGRPLAFHVAGSLAAHTLAWALFDDVRDLIEETIGAADAGIRTAHDPYGRELSATDLAGSKTELLASSPLWKARLAAKLPLPDLEVGAYGLASAWSIGLTAPAFGRRAGSGNGGFALDTTLAFALPVAACWRLTGAVNLALPGTSDTLDDLGVGQRDLVPGAILSLEWWISRSFALSLGATWNGAATEGASLPTDHASLYANLGLLWRPTDSLALHLLVTENPGGKIAVEGTPTIDYAFDVQKDADFAVTFGASFSL